jgi:hypothetical protein
MKVPLTEKDLHIQLADVRNRYPRLKDDEIFLLWFMSATVTDNENEAATALTGHSRDKGTDAVLTDDRSKLVSVVQGKYHKKINKTNESRPDVMSFAQIACDLHGTDEQFKAFLKEIDTRVHEKFRYARECLRRRGYRLKLYFVTTAKCSSSLIQEAGQKCRQAEGPAFIEIFDGKRVLLTLSDFLDGVAPPVPSLDLPLEVGKGVTSECHRRHDARENITAWIFSMNASAVADMYETAGIRLFARNVRGFLGKSTQVNRGMHATLSTEPWNFWYYNNGVTMICDRAERISVGGRDVMRVSNPQIINGQQTTRTLHEADGRESTAAVLVKAIMVPRDPRAGSEKFDMLVSRIVAATNWQNAIRASDLMANDRRQIEIERELRKFNYYYLRKRQSKSEARRFIGAHQRVVTKEDIAQAVAGCELDPAIVREGKEGLFEEHLYPKVFPTSDPHFYLNRFRLKYEVRHRSKGYPERAYATWLVLHIMWSRVAPIIRSRGLGGVFREASERHQQPIGYLSDAVNSAFRAALSFYRHEKGQGEKAIDVSTFFKRKGLEPEFETYLRGRGRAFSKTVEKRLKRFEAELRKLAS